MEEANRLLEYVKGKSGRPYQVCIVMPLGEYEQKLKDVERNASCDGYDDGYRVGFDSGSKYSD